MPRSTVPDLRRVFPPGAARRRAGAANGSLATHVADRLREAIVDGRFRLGEALSELTLAAALGVSRTPVREALTALQREGLIDIRPQAGSFVFLPSGEDVGELAEFRHVLEIAALRLAYVRRRQAMLGDLRQAMAAMEQARAAADARAFARADDAFHAGLVANSANEHLVGAYRLVAGRVAALRAHNLRATDAVRRGVLGEHRAIVAALAKGDLDGASGRLAEHLLRMRVRYRLPAAPDKA